MFPIIFIEKLVFFMVQIEIQPKGDELHMKLQLIKRALDEKELPMLTKDRDEMIHEYMKLKESSLKKLMEIYKKHDNQ